jgi:hypothetical protein
MPTKNFVSDFGGVGDGQRSTLIATITSGTGALSVVSGSFVTGDVGKAIAIWSGNNYYFGAISARSSANAITITPNITFSLASASSDILWGTDNTNAFTGVSGSWRAYAQTQTNPVDIPILQIPDGSYAFRSDTFAGGAMHYNVLNSVKVSGLSGTAANCKLMQFNNSEMRFGTDPAIVANAGLNNAGGNSARLQTAASGATSVLLVDPTAYGARIVVGRVCLIAAYDMQGLYESFFGYPPNSFFFEWNVITAYNSGTGQVTLQNPLTQAYKSTYPRWGTENTIFGSDQGGPATIWVAPDGYNNTVTLENMTIDSPHNQCATHMRNQTLNNLIMSGPGLYPTQNDIVEINNCVYPQSLEIDKMVNQVTWNNSTINILQQQSASPNRMILNGGTINQLETAKYTEANNVAFGGSGIIICGVSAYGRTDRIVLNGCTDITAFQRGGASTSDLGGSSGPGSVQNASDYYVFVSGVLKFLKSSNDSAGGQGQQNITRLFVPGTWITFDDKYIDRISDVYEDGTYCYVQFANTTNWPFTPVARLFAHSCPDFTMRNCTGTAPELEDWNQATARIPLYSYSKRAYTADGTGTTVKARPSVIGRLVTVKLNVTTPASVTFHESQFDNWPMLKADYSTYTFPPTIACVNGGLRTINGISTASGAQGSDSIPDLTSVGQVWSPGASFSGPIFSANGSNAVITVEFTMDQGIPPAVPVAVAPLRLRLRAA